MTHFEQVGINAQYDAGNIKEANKSFTWSCNCCCHKGKQINCDRCGIAFAHNLVVANFRDIEEMKIKA